MNPGLEITIFTRSDTMSMSDGNQFGSDMSYRYLRKMGRTCQLLFDRTCSILNYFCSAMQFVYLLSRIMQENLKLKCRSCILKNRMNLNVLNGSDTFFFGSDIQAFGSDNVRCPTAISSPAGVPNRHCLATFLLIK